MGKAEVGTPKYIANKIKAKGLQKLRWYCQMCEKQCRDENGFKCHTLSESHQRQLLLFAENPHKFMDEFSRKFVKDFCDLLRCMFGTKRVLANKVYQEYITDRKHLHMNATQWGTLTEFVKWLGKAGKCVVDETEKGWFITYIDRNPEMIRLQEQSAKKKKMEKDEEEEMAEFLKKQIERGKATTTANEAKPTELIKNDDEKISINLGASTSKVPIKLSAARPSVFASASKTAPKLLPKPSVFGDDKSKHKTKTVKKSTDKRPPPNILEEIMKEDQRNMYKKTKRY